MSNRKNDRSAQRSALSIIREEHEVRYWITELGVTKDELVRAVDKAGVSVEKVREHLRKK